MSKQLFKPALIGEDVTVKDIKNPDVWVGKLTKSSNHVDNKEWLDVQASEKGTGLGKTMKLSFDTKTVLKISGKDILLG